MKTRLIVPTALAVAVVAGAAYATIPDQGGMIRGCYAHSTGDLRVVDQVGGEQCKRNETALAWAQRGPQGDTGPAGPATATIDDLDGVRCKGVRGKLATVRVDYGAGLEAPLSLTCLTHLVANHGAFTLHVTGATLDLPFLGRRELPSAGWHVGGTFDFQGKFAVPAPAFELRPATMQGTAPLGGFASVNVSATLSLTGTGLTGVLDPEPGTGRADGGVYATVALAATAQVAGQTVPLFAGTCALGTTASPIPLAFAFDPPYSQTTGAATLAAPVSPPSLSGCNPAIPAPYAFLLDLFAGNGRLTVTGSTDPIVKAT